MEEIRTVGQVLQTAITREMQAVQFYMDLALRAEDPARKSLFHQLAEEELKHKSRLELEMLKEGLVVKRLGQLDDVGEAEYTADLALGPDAEYRDVVSMGVRKERRAFRFYTQLAGIVGEKSTRDVLLELAEEEARHLVQFEAEYNRLVAEGR